MVITEQNFIQERFNVSVRNKAIVQFFMVTGYKFYGKILGNDTFNYLVQITDAEGNPKELKTSLVFKSAISTIETPFIPDIDLETPKKQPPLPSKSPVPQNNNQNQNQQNKPQNQNSNQNNNNQNGGNTNKNNQQNNQNKNQNGNTLPQKSISQQIKSLSGRVKQLEIKCFPNMHKEEAERLPKVSKEEVVTGISKADQVNNLVAKSKESKKEESNKEKENKSSGVEVNQELSLEELMGTAKKKEQNENSAVESVSFENKPKDVIDDTSSADEQNKSKEKDEKKNAESESDDRSIDELMSMLNLG